MFHVPERWRLTKRHFEKGGEYLASDASYGNNGAFEIPRPGGTGEKFFVIASDGERWEHCSVSIAGRDHPPSWEEMCMIKALFWDPEDCVIQYHPPQSENVNKHPGVLHLWRPMCQGIPRPPMWMVG